MGITHKIALGAVVLVTAGALSFATASDNCFDTQNNDWTSRSSNYAVPDADSFESDSDEELHKVVRKADFKKAMAVKKENDVPPKNEKVEPQKAQQKESSSWRIFVKSIPVIGVIYTFLFG